MIYYWASCLSDCLLIYFRSRPPNGSRGDVSFSASPEGVGGAGGTGLKAPPGSKATQPAPLTRVHTPANVTPHHRLSKDLCLVPHAISIDGSPGNTLTHTHNTKLMADEPNQQHHSAHSPQGYSLSLNASSMITSNVSSSCVNIMTKTHLSNLSQQQNMIPERDTGPSKVTSPLKSTSHQVNAPIKSVSSPSKLTVQSTPVKSQNPMISYGLERGMAVGRKEGVGVKEWRGVQGGQDDGPVPQPQQHHHINIAQDVRSGLQVTYLGTCL